IVETLGKRTVCRHCLSIPHNKPTCRLAKSVADRKADKQAKRRQKRAAANRRRRAHKEEERAKAKDPKDKPDPVQPVDPPLSKVVPDPVPPATYPLRPPTPSVRGDKFSAFPHLD